MQPAPPEVDDIMSMLAYALVYQDWQSADVPREERRGYNIGAVLVDRRLNRPVAHGLNSITQDNDPTQHGELRAIMGYLHETPTQSLSDFTLYATLEPCVMCAGMITMTGIPRVVYGQHDVTFSRAFERLALDSRSIGGFGPYPRTVAATVSRLPYGVALDTAYRQFMQTDPEKYLAKFLTGTEAESVFNDARTAFLNYETNDNQLHAVYQASRTYFDRQVFSSN